MESYGFLLIIAIILLSTKVLGVLSEKVHMPQVVGALIAGVILGPSVLGFLTETEFIKQTAEIGVILLMFAAGLETDLEELKENGFASFLIALMGVILPLIGGALVYFFFYKDTSTEPLFMLKCIFVGVVLTATSVSITVETLREMGKLKGKMGTTILGAAIIDDIIGIIILTIITSMTDSTVNPVTVLVKIVLFFVFFVIVGFFVHLLKRFIEEQNGKRRSSIYAVAFALIMAFVAEHFFGIADITGAYFAGILLCTLGVKSYVEKKVTVVSYMIFSPIFFASIGIKTNLEGFTPQLFIFALVLLIVAILTKIVGCGIGAKVCKFDNISALSIGIGMVSRGEVALIVAQKGSNAGLLDSALFPAIVIVVIVTTLLTPILLKVILSKNTNDTAQLQS
ncbi:MAG: cation:proton antiporter, partial [Eubacteriales bacterium]|nr:cation:proton antiporter [Eubacteriales bacterium]